MPLPITIREERPAHWWKRMTGYHWFAFAIASLAWLFDCLDQRLFSLARIPALTALMPGADTGAVQAAGKQVTAVFLVGWGIGGVVFGALGDRHGRAKMLYVTVLTYSIFTGLSFFSQGFWDFAAARFLTGLGVGGVFGLAVALIAETVPADVRVAALGALQVLSAIGNVSAGFIKSAVDAAQRQGLIAADQGWRWMFLAGTIPAVVVIAARKRLREPPSWIELRDQGRLPTSGILAPYRDLMRERQLRWNLVVGSAIASTGVIGLWGIGEYAVDLQKIVFRNHFVAAGVEASNIDALVNDAIVKAYLLNMLGAAIGMTLFTKAAARVGRRQAFFVAFGSALAMTLLAYGKMDSPRDAYWMMPLMGIAQLSAFAGFAIYLPELFPGRLRSTGTSFCYNCGRFAAAAGSLFSARLATDVYGHFGSPLRERYSAMTMCAVFLMGMAILPFAPETSGKELPR